MKERPILMSGVNIPPLIDDSKTQTRRIAKFVGLPGSGFNPEFSGYDLGHYCTGVPSSGWVLRSRGSGGCWNDRTKPLHSPYGTPGDRLWVKETWQAFWANPDVAPLSLARPDGWTIGYVATDGVQEWHDEDDYDNPIKTTCKPSIFMRRWMSRITLEVTAVRVERLRDISEADAKAEGIRSWSKDGALFKFGVEPGVPGAAPWTEMQRTAVDAYRLLWESINGIGSWALNPWVWVIEFRRIP